MSTTALSFPAPLSAERYVRNLWRFWRTNPRLAMAVEAVHPDDLPPVEPAKDGACTVQLAGNYLHSRYRPLTEAAPRGPPPKRPTNAMPSSSPALASATTSKPCSKNCRTDALLVVAEPNVALLKAAFAAVDVEPSLDSQRVLIFTSLDRGHLVERLEPRSVLFTAGQGMLMLSHPASVQSQPAFHAAFQKLITEFISFTRTGFSP